MTITQLGVGEVTITVTATNPAGLSATQIFMARATGIQELADDVQSNNYLIPENYLNAYMYGNLGRTEDVIRIDLSPGVTYQMDLEGFDTNVGTLADPYLELRLWDTDIFIDGDDDSGQLQNAQLRFTPPNSAVLVDYALIISRSGTRDGTYRLHITTP